LSERIVAAHGKNHLSMFKELGVENKEQLIEHTYKTLEDRNTKLIMAQEGRQKGVCFAHNETTNTFVVFSHQNKQFTHTTYRPDTLEDGKARFETKIKNVTKDQGYAPEIKRGIQELLPTLRKELKVEQTPVIARERQPEPKQEPTLKREETAGEMRRRLLAEAEKALAQERQHDRKEERSRTRER
jgi:hypothetical protein